MSEDDKMDFTPEEWHALRLLEKAMGRHLNDLELHIWINGWLSSRLSKKDLEDVYVKT